MTSFDKDQVFQRYSALNAQEDELYREILALEYQAKRNGYILGVLPDGAWRPDGKTCSIREMTSEEYAQFLAADVARRSCLDA